MNYQEQQEELRERMSAKIAEMKAVLVPAETEHRAMTATEDEQYRRLDVELAALDLEFRDSQLTTRSIRPDVGVTRSVARDGWIDERTGREVRLLKPSESVRERGSTAEADALDLAAALRGIVTGNWSRAERERRAMMTEGVSASGGWLLPSPLSAEVIDLARARSVAIALGARTVPMSSSTLDLAQVMADPTGSWYPEEVRAAGLTESAATFGRLSLQARTLAVLCRASIELAEDAPNFGVQIQNQIAQALGLALDSAILYGLADGTWSGLRTWLPANAAASINEVKMGAADGAVLADYSPFVTAAKAIFDGNYKGDTSGLGIAFAPRTWATLENLQDTLHQPLRKPDAVAAMKALTSTQISITETQGASQVASTAFVGDWSQIIVGMRTEIQLEATRTGYDSFQRLHVLIRGYLRADWAVMHPKHMTRIIGITG